MESYRGFLLLALGFISFLMYQQWQEDYAPTPEVSQSATRPAAEVPSGQTEVTSESDIPTATPTKTTTANTPTAEQVTLSNNVLEIAIDTYGNNIT